MVDMDGSIWEISMSRSYASLGDRLSFSNSRKTRVFSGFVIRTLLNVDERGRDKLRRLTIRFDLSKIATINN